MGGVGRRFFAAAPREELPNGTEHRSANLVADGYRPACGTSHDRSELAVTVSFVPAQLAGLDA